MSLLNNKYLFVHINKSCGGIITKNFKKCGDVKITGKHRTLQDMLNIALIDFNINKENLYIFTIVRNPWARMLSMYLFYHKSNYNSPEFFSGNTKIDNNFNNWIEYIYSNEFDRTRIHSAVNIYKCCFSNQLNWVKDDDSKIINNVHIFKVEDLDIHKFLTEELNLKNANGNAKIHPTKHKHYSQYYNNKSINLVAEHYKDDIEYFNYKFEYEKL
jgi:hypothetical protein